MPTTKENYVIRGRDGYYVIRQVSAGETELVAGHDKVPGGLFAEWHDCEPESTVYNHARRMIRKARAEGIEEEHPMRLAS